MDVLVRGISPDVWNALRVEAVRRQISVAKLIEMLWQERNQTTADDLRRRLARRV